jgi:hypothetical protein
MDNLPEEILLKTFSNLNILDLGECAVVSKRFQRICQDQSLEYSKNHTIPSLYKTTTSYHLRELVKLGEYEKTKEFYRKGWTNQWHLDDNVTFECRNYTLTRLLLAMKPSPEKDDFLVEYAKHVEKTMYNIATTKLSYFYLMAESIYNNYHLSNPYDFDLTNELITLTDKRAHQVQARNRNGALIVQGVYGVQNVHQVAQVVHSVHSFHRLDEPVEQKFVRTSNFKSGLRRKFILFSDSHQVKEDEDLGKKPKNVKLKHLARGGPWIKTNMETYQKDGTSPLHSELSSGRLRRKQEPKRLLNIS